MGKSKEKESNTRKAKPDEDAGKQITDARFDSVHSDPRFREPRRGRAKVAVDSRFTGMFTDKRFGRSGAPTDKRGKPKKKDASAAAGNPLAHYYRAEDAKESKVDESEESSSDDDTDMEEEVEEEVESSDDDSSTTGSSSSDSEEEEEEEEEKIPEIDKETNRLAVMSMDWNEVKAVDLYVLLRSFLPKEGRIVSVAVYPSEFGLKRMEEEEVRGPALFRKDDDDEEESDDDEDDDEDIDEEVRAYELSRLRYYYAVVEFESVATADYIYKNCDGVEFERSGAKLDLRFIPDSMEFKHPPRDVANKVPEDYEGVDFNTRALQLSKVDLTWDDDEPHRSKTLKRKFNDDQLAELELQEFVASDESSGSDEEEEDDAGEGEDKSVRKQKKKDAYRALVQSGDGLDENGDEDEKDMDMEVTFNPGLDNLSKRLLEQKDKESETVWEAQQRKSHEKKKARYNRSKDSSDDYSSDGNSDQEPLEQPDDFFVDDVPADKGSKQAKGKDGKRRKQTEEASQAAEASRAELELLFADDDGASNPHMKGYNLKKKNKAKGKKGKDVVDEEKLPAAEYNDSRFSGLFTSPEFALDPTDPQFKRSAVYVRQLAQKQRGGPENKEIKPDARFFVPNNTEVQNEEESQATVSKRAKLELSTMIKSVKLKTQQFPQQGEVRQVKNSLKKEKLPATEYSDPRFSGLSTSPKTALDPTDSQLKRRQKKQRADYTEVQNEEESQANVSKRKKKSSKKSKLAES